MPDSGSLLPVFHNVDNCNRARSSWNTETVSVFPLGNSPLGSRISDLFQQIVISA